jgi:ubiquinone/menaquinone biosynthesis C-methylase UbiE
MTTEVTTVKQFYETDAAVTFEAKRLEEASPFELPVTMHHLKPLLFPGAKVLEVGVGCGHVSLDPSSPYPNISFTILISFSFPHLQYTSELASLGCSIHIVDIADTFLDQTRKRLEGEGRGNYIIGSTNASGTNLSSFSSQSFDFVLLLGPLYHLCKLEERITCVQEATRVLKPGGYIVAGAVLLLSSSSSFSFTSSPSLSFLAVSFLPHFIFLFLTSFFVQEE